MCLPAYSKYPDQVNSFVLIALNVSSLPLDTIDSKESVSHASVERSHNYVVKLWKMKQ